METLQFDSGVRCFQVNDGGVLRFNPADPNVFARFLEAGEKLAAMEQKLTGNSGEELLTQMRKIDGEVKALLGYVFGPGNDFEDIFRGVNLLAAAGNGQRVITNFLAALEPILLEGAQQCARAEAAK